MNTMVVSQDIINKMNNLSNNDFDTVVQLINNLSKSPLDIFDELRTEGLKNPLSDEEIDDFVSSVKKERYAASN